MNILESQVTDLNYLAESPIALSGSMNGHRQSSSAESPADTGAASGKKRKAEETNGHNSGNTNGNGATTHTRAKRNRYISIACNECKRRKIKCNGNTPCQRCGNLSLECQYAPNCCSNGFKESEEFRQMNAHLASLQEQVDALYANLNALRPNGEALGYAPHSERSLSVSQSGQAVSPVSRYRTTPRHLSYHGPTSSAFSLDVAKNTLHNMGYQGLGDEGVITSDATPVASPGVIPPAPPLSSENGSSPTRDPLWSFSKEEAIRLCRVYEEEIGLMYPVVDIEAIIQHATTLYDFLDAAVRHRLAPSTPQGKRINDEQSCLLKVILAVTTVVEGNGQSEVGDRLFESVKEVADKIQHSESIDIKSLPFIAIVAMYHFHCDEEALAWRTIGQAFRMCVELGLHRRDSLFKAITEEEERTNAIRVLWSIYVLDRRWSFGTGLPFAVQEADIDPSLPEPGPGNPYLNTMISYSRIGSKAFRSVCSIAPIPTPPINTEEIGYLDYQILSWQKSIPPELQLSPNPPTRATHRLQILLYLRCNQMRILIYRPVLHSASSIQEHLTCASTVIELAKDTIRALTHLNQTTDIYRCQQVCFNYFLTSAIAVLFLASCHAPVHFSSVCRDEFYMALDLVKGFSNKSWVSKRLWKTIKGLKEVGPKLGLGREGGENDAALAMAGLAGHDIGYGAMDDGGVNANQMSHDMTSLFEAALAGGYADALDGGVGGGGVVGSMAFGGDEELYRQMRDLF